MKDERSVVNGERCLMKDDGSKHEREKKRKEKKRSWGWMMHLGSLMEWSSEDLDRVVVDVTDDDAVVEIHCNSSRKAELTIS